MRKAFYLSLLALCLSHSISAQQYGAKSNSVGFALSSTGDEIRPPKLLPPVTAMGDEDALLFRWEETALPNGTEVLYEFILSDEKGVIYTTKTKETSLVYDLSLPLLSIKAGYLVVVNTFITNNDRSYVVYGTDSALPFIYSPKCSIPKNVQITENGHDFIQVSWGGLRVSSFSTHKTLLNLCAYGQENAFETASSQVRRGFQNRSASDGNGWS